MLAPDNPNAWGTMMELKASVAMELEVPALTVSELMKLGVGSVLTSKWPTNRDLPLRVNGHLLAWAEFETTGENVGARITEFEWEQLQASE
jgi:flagellar motor switch/type III secretory pathway protein FliN